MKFNDIFKFVEEKNNIEDSESDPSETCLICHFPDKKKNLLKLKCGHYYHSCCIFNDEKPKDNFKFICPYCGLKQKIKLNDSQDESSKSASNLKCTAIIKSGINKGKICGRINCRYHKI